MGKNERAQAPGITSEATRRQDRLIPRSGLIRIFTSLHDTHTFPAITL